MKRFFSVMLCILFLFSLVSAVPPFETQVNVGSVGLQIFYPPYNYIPVGQGFNLHIHVSNLSDGKELTNDQANCSIHIYDKTGSHVLEANFSKDSNLIDWEIEIEGGNFSEIGVQAFRIFCEDTVGGTVGGVFNVNYLGKAPPEGFDGRFILLLCFILLFVGLAYLQKEINFDKWYQGILKKYNHRNFFRTFISKLGFFFMNNPYSLFYMIGLFIMLLMYDVTRAYALVSAYNVMEVLVMIYLFAMFFLFIELLGDIHEFFSKIAEDIKSMGWGMSGDSGLLDTDKIGGGK